MLDPIQLFAHRLRTRDVPPPVAPLLFDRASVLERLRIGVAVKGLAPLYAGQRHMAKLLYAFVGAAEPTTVVALSQEIGSAPSWLRAQVQVLVAAGLVERFRLKADGRSFRLRLTRAGEDWVQSLVQVPLEGPVTVQAATETTAPAATHTAAPEYSGPPAQG